MVNPPQLSRLGNQREARDPAHRWPPLITHLEEIHERGSTMYTRFTRLPLALVAALLLLAGCASSAVNLTPTATPLRPGEFSVYAKSPVIPHGVTSAWAARYVDPGAMIYHNGAFHMFINAFNSYPGVTSIGYATSPDGYTWSLASHDPVFTSDKVTYAQAAIFVSGVLVGDDGTWTLYF